MGKATNIFTKLAEVKSKNPEPYTTSFKEEISPYYDGNVEGGFRGAVKSAKKAQKNSTHGMNTPAFNLRNARINTQVPISFGQMPKGYEGNAGVFIPEGYSVPDTNFTYPRSIIRLMPIKKFPSKESYKSTVDHELTHFIGGDMKDNEAEVLDRGRAYNSRRGELDPRAAHIKRQYAKNKKVLVNTPEKAEQAINWYKELLKKPSRKRKAAGVHTHGGENHWLIGPRGEKNTNYLINRMPEVVDNTKKSPKNPLDQQEQPKLAHIINVGEHNMNKAETLFSKLAQAMPRRLTQKELGVRITPDQDIKRTETQGLVTFNKGDNTQKKRDIVKQLSEGVTDNPKVQEVISNN